MLSFLQSKEGLKTSGVRGHERKRQEKHLQSIEAIRERNEKLIKVSGSLAKHLPELAPVHANGGPNASTPEKQAAMTDVLIAALKANLTNVVTYTIDDLGTPITGLPGNETDRVGIHRQHQIVDRVLQHPWRGHSHGRCGDDADEPDQKRAAVLEGVAEEASARRWSASSHSCDHAIDLRFPGHDK